MLRDGSPLHGLPGRLPRKQVLYFDALRTSLEMAEIAYQRLQCVLMADDDPARMPRALLDAWSLIDILNRVRVLVRTMPGLKQNAPPVQALLRKTADVEVLRNAVQHLYGEIERMSSTTQPVWGSLSWVRYQEEGVIDVCLLLSGTLAAGHRAPLVNPWGKLVHVPVGMVTLTAAEKDVCLSDLMDALTTFTACLEHAAGEAFAALPSGSVNELAQLRLVNPAGD